MFYKHHIRFIDLTPHAYDGAVVLMMSPFGKCVVLVRTDGQTCPADDDGAADADGAAGAGGAAGPEAGGRGESSSPLTNSGLWRRTDATSRQSSCPGPSGRD